MAERTNGLLTWALRVVNGASPAFRTASLQEFLNYACACNCQCEMVKAIQAKAEEESTDEQA